MKRRPSRSDVSLIVLVLLIDLLNVAIAHAAERGDFGGLVDIGDGAGSERIKSLDACFPLPKDNAFF